MSLSPKLYCEALGVSNRCCWRQSVRGIRGFQFVKPHQIGYYRYKPWKRWPKMDTKYFQMQLDALRLRPAPAIPYNKFIADSNITVEDPNDPKFPIDRKPPPVEIAHPAFKPAPKPEDHPLYKERPRFLVDLSEPLSESVNHALALTKSLRFNGLPPEMMRNIELPNQDVQLTKAIMQSQEWDSTISKMPPRRRPEKPWRAWPAYAGTPVWRKNEVLLANLLRLCNQFAPQFPGLQGRSVLRVVCHHANYERGEDLVCTSIVPCITVLSRSALAPVAAAAEVDQSINTSIVDISPTGFTVDFPKEHIYSDRILCPQIATNSDVHTILLSQGYNYDYPWTQSQNVANAVVATFGAALAAAKTKYGDEPLERLRQPVVVQGIQVCRNLLNFVVFQLNTLNFADDNGVKNMVWIDKGNQMFFLPDWWDNMLKVEEMNVEVFQKFAALILNGASKPTFLHTSDHNSARKSRLQF